MYRAVFVENVLLQGQNGKTIENSASFGDIQVIRGAVFWIRIKKIELLDQFSIFIFFNRREILSSLIYYRTGIYKIWTVFEL